MSQSVLKTICFILPSILGGFPGGSEVKVPASNAGDLGSIPGSGSPLEKEVVTHSSILAWRTLWQRSLVAYSPWGHIESDTTE